MIVSLPEEMPVNETARLEDELMSDIGMAVDQVIMNALYPDRFPSRDRKAIKRLKRSKDPEVRAGGKAALSQSRRVAAQTEQLKRLEDMVATPVSTLPFIFRPEIDLHAARQLAEEIE